MPTMRLRERSEPVNGFRRDAKRRVEGARTMTDEQKTKLAFARSLSNAGLGWTRNRESVLWHIYSGQFSSSSTGTAFLLEKHGLIKFSRNFLPGTWKLTDSGRDLLFNWKSISEHHNVK